MRRRQVCGVLALTALGLAACTSTTDLDPPTAAPSIAQLSPSSPAPAVEPLPRNGRIADVRTRFGMEHFVDDWLDYEPVSGTGLFMACRDDDGLTYDGCIGHHFLVVIEPGGHRTNLTCPRGSRCDDVPSWQAHLRGATLGPGRDEVTVLSGDATVRVVGYDGRPRRRIDLPRKLIRGELFSVDWSPDGGRLAVVARAARRIGVWVVDGARSRSELVYELHRPSAIWDGPLWAPDGQRLLLDLWLRPLRPGEVRVDLDVVVLQVPTDASVTAVADRTLYRSQRHFDSIPWNLAWSPDGRPRRSPMRRSGPAGRRRRGRP